MTPRSIMVDGNEAVAMVAHRCSEVIALYPITPSSSMGELCDDWAAKGKANLWGAVPEIMEMQSEGGAIGAVHGALQAGTLATTFTASQGLLLMIPNLYKIAGELTAFCMHVAARTVATHALSIFGDHSDVMAVRQCGLGLLCSSSVQEAHDFALIGLSASLRTRVPFLHFFDGFRTSHEIGGLLPLSDEDMLSMLPAEDLAAHRERALTPDRPVLRGSAQNPDTFFQAREACNPFYLSCPSAVQQCFDELATRTGRQYRLFDYAGHPQAERVIVLMGSGGETAEEAALHLSRQGQRVGVVRVRLFRPFDSAAMLAALPRSTKVIAVLDRTKEPGAVGEPLFQDVLTVLAEDGQTDAPRFSVMPRVVGGRYGLSSKEFTPGMVMSVFAELAQPRPRSRFTVGIVDDVTGLSLPWQEVDIEDREVSRAVFYGLGSDGTVGANKNSIKILGEEGGRYAQGYFVYDSKKAGAVTVSHLRFGLKPIRAPYLVQGADFVGIHQFPFVDRFDPLKRARPGATLLINSPHGPQGTWDRLPLELQSEIIGLGVKLFVIDAYAVAAEAGVGRRINTVMQTCWFAISGVLPAEEAITRIKAAIDKTYGKRGAQVLASNHRAVDNALAALQQVEVPAAPTTTRRRPAPVSHEAPDLVQRVLGMMLGNNGDLLPVSAFPVDGTWPTGTARWEKRNLAQEIPSWDAALCIQCNKCAMVCPHAAIRIKAFPSSMARVLPEGTPTLPYKGRELNDHRYIVQVAPEDCTGCTICVEVCPAKDKGNPRHKALDMVPQAPIREREIERFEGFLELPELEDPSIKLDLRTAQLMQPLFEFSGACAGCGETPYIKLLTQLVGDHLLIANATGCSSIYGGNLPTTPYTTNRDGRGPAWSNSLFEDNAEFGLGMRLAVDHLSAVALQQVEALAPRLAPLLGEETMRGLLAPPQKDRVEIAAQRRRVQALRAALAGIEGDVSKRLSHLADYLVQKSVWMIGGDGWAYDIGYGGLDHVLSTGRDINVLVLDTEVYSNTGGQQSKATPRGASARFAVAGKATAKKDLGLMMMAYGSIYVARIAFGAKDAQTVKALQEAESFPGPAIVIAYSHCVAHGYDLAHGLEQQKVAVETGYWPLYRYDPRRLEQGEAPMQLDSAPPKGDVGRFMRAESRFRVAEAIDPERFRLALGQAQEDVATRWALYQALAGAPAQRSLTDAPVPERSR